MRASEASVTALVGEEVDVFSTDHLHADLKERSIRGGMATLASQLIKFGLSFMSQMALVRFLTPNDFGLVAMVSPITGFIGLFKDFGLSMATVQKDKVTHAQVSTLFWLNVAVSVLLTLTAAAISPAVAWFYGDPRTMWVTLAISVNFIFGGLTAQHSALLQRSMKFKTLAIIEVVGLAASALVGVVTASSWVGWGYWSLVAMNLTFGSVNCLAVWIASPWRPGRPTRQAGTRSMVKVGSDVTLATVITYVATQIDRIALGKFYTPTGATLASAEDLVSTRKAALGIYSRSQVLFITPLMQIMVPLDSVMMPLFSRLAGDRQRLRKVTGHIMEVATALMLPVAIGCFFCSDLIVQVLFGGNPQWAIAAPVTRAFAVMVLTLPVGMVVNALFVATGRSDVMAKWSLFWTIMLIPTVAIGLRWGPVGVALALGLAHVVSAPIHLYIGHRIADLDLRHIGRLVALNCVSLVLCGGAILIAQQVMRGIPGIVTVIIYGLLILFLHTLTLYLFGTIDRIRQLLRGALA